MSFDGPQRSHVIQGAVCGLGATAVVWTAALLPPGELGPAAAFLLLGSTTGLLGSRRHRDAGIAESGFAVTALLLHGPGAAVLAVSLGRAVAFFTPRRDGRPPAAHAGAVQIGRHALAGTIGALAWLAGRGGGVASGWGDIVIPLAGFVLLRTAVDRVVDGALANSARPPRLAVRRWARTLAVGFAGALVGLLIAALHAFPGGPTGLLLIPAAAVALALHDSAPRRRKSDGRGSEAAYRTIAAGLARAIGARERGVTQHLDRVRDLSLAIGRRIGLDALQLEALAIAAQLHEIESLAVAESGASTDVSCPRVRAHPSVCDEILDAIAFPDAVQPIVRHQHERWNGAGHPDALAGEEIPIGARILAAVDCYDALVFNRPARRVLPCAEALNHIRRESGRKFDPRVVSALAAQVACEAGDSVLAVSHSAAPDAVDDLVVPDRGRFDGARAELLGLYEIERVAAHRLDVEENLGLIAAKVAALIPHESLVLYRSTECDGALVARFAWGASARRLVGHRIPPGQRLSGWAAAERRAISGGARRAADTWGGFHWDFDDGEENSALAALRTALSAPLVARGVSLGALTLYDRDDRSFTVEERATLVAIAGHMARAVSRADPRDPDYLQSLTDPLTGLPNARYLEICAADFTPGRAGHGHGFGLLAFHVGEFESICQRSGIAAAERLVAVVARRLAAACEPNEVPVRFGRDLFLVLRPAADAAELLVRWERLLEAGDSGAVELPDGAPTRPGLIAALAQCPHDGSDLEALIAALGARLDDRSTPGARVIPFRVAHQAG